MDWISAVRAMQTGVSVRRRSETYIRQLEADVFEEGEEGIRLLCAWTDDEKPVRVYVGASSGFPFVPEGKHREAQDWETVIDHGAPSAGCRAGVDAGPPSDDQFAASKGSR